MAKVEAIDYGDRSVYPVSAFVRGVAGYLERLPSVWVEGEISELRRQDRWQQVFFTLRDVAGPDCIQAAMARGPFDALDLGLENGERVHVYGRAELWQRTGEFRLKALTIERFGQGDHLAALERLKRKLAAEGLFAAERKRPLPRLPRRIGLVTGNDAAAKRDVITAVTARFPPARLLVAETLVQGPRAAVSVIDALRTVGAEPGVDVIILSRGGGSFEDLLPFSDERLVRAVAASPVPVVSAIGHEQDTPLCDLAADVRAATPTAAARLVVPDLDELIASLDRARGSIQRERTAGRRTPARAPRAGRRPPSARRAAARRAAACVDSRSSTAASETLSPRATLARGYAIVRAQDRRRATSPARSPLETGSTSSSRRDRSRHGSRR